MPTSERPRVAFGREVVHDDRQHVTLPLVDRRDPAENLVVHLAGVFLLFALHPRPRSFKLRLSRSRSVAASWVRSRSISRFKACNRTNRSASTARSWVGLNPWTSRGESPITNTRGLRSA